MNINTGEIKPMADITPAEKATGDWHPLEIVDIARICHETNRAYCKSIGDNSQPAWDDAPLWQKKSAVAGVKFALAAERKPEDSHNSWLAEKEREGWKYGPSKDSNKKEHPCIVPYEQLPAAQKLKDHLFLAIVNVFTKKGLPDGAQKEA